MSDGKIEKTVSLDGTDFYTLLDHPPNPSTPPKYILLVHALMSNHTMWDPTIQLLHSLGYSVLRYDHMGHNRTPPPSSSTTLHMDDLTRQMHALVHAATGQKTLSAVMGCSIGGVLALVYSLRYPNAVSDVISIAAPGIATPAAAPPLWRARIAQFEEDVRTGGEVLCKQTAERWVPGEEEGDVEARQKALEQVRTCGIEGYRILVGAICGYDYDGEVGGMKARTLVVAGGRDGAASPEGLEELAGRLKDGRFVCLEEAGHLPPLHRPGEFNEVLKGFLEG